MKRLSIQTVRQNKFDLTLALIVTTMTIFGLVMVYDASVSVAIRDYKDSFYYLRQQALWFILGIFFSYIFSVLDYHIFKRFSLVLMVSSVLLLLAVFIPGLGISGGGAHRWLNFGFVTIQPAEIIKLTGAIYLARVFEKGSRLLPLLAVVIFITVVTAVLQKDLGSTTVFVITAGVMYFTSGAPVFQFLMIIPLAVASFIGLTFSSSYRLQRILAFLSPFSDTQGFTYHISQILLALGSGGFFGLGLGQSRQKFEYIPEVTTDSIFAVIGEEFGFVGGTILIILFALLVIRGFKIAEGCNDKFGKNLAIGLTSWLGVQAIINLSSMSALLPLTGVPLPFISYGGSALVANLVAVGVLLNISKNKV